MNHQGGFELRLSEGTAAVLGLKPLRQTAAPTAAYLMLGGECPRDCAFCAQARSASGPAGRLSRVTWPRYELSSVLPPLAQACADGRLRRICVQTTAGPAIGDELAGLLAALRGAGCDRPVSASVYVRDLGQLSRLFELGLDHAGLAIDVADAGAFAAIKGGSLDAARDFLESAAAAFPGRISTHLIVGLGETERQLLELFAWCAARSITAGLFAFTPVRGTRLQDAAAPDMAAYRRVQAGCYLLLHGHITAAGIHYDEGGRVAGLPLSSAALRRLLGDGRAFETSGCPDCNRPYYNERPGQTLFNHPRPLTAAELAPALAPVLRLAADATGDSGCGLVPAHD